jgi:esterase/lipase
MPKILLRIIIVLLLVILGVTLWCTNPASHHLRFQDTGLNTHLVVGAQDSFQQYLTISHDRIQLARNRGGVDASSAVVADNAPYALFPDENSCKKTPDNKFENGILMVHGFLDSAYSMRYLAQFFRDKCFVVYVVVLPGHGTVPGDLLRVNYRDWINATHFGATKIAEQAQNIYIMGYSLGGLLAINEVLQNPKAFKAALLFAPCLAVKTPYAALIAPAYWLSQFIPRLKWLSLRNDDINVRYESYPLNPVYQITKLMNKVQRQLAGKSISIPIFMQQSADDMTVDPLVNLDFFQKNTNVMSKLIWYSESTAEKHLADSRIKFIFGALPEQKILDMSHLSYLMPSTDPIYGWHGEYHDCLYYAPHSSQWLQCKMSNDNYLGEITAGNVKQHVMQRLTFNPFEKELYSELTAFVEGPARE